MTCIAILLETPQWVRFIVAAAPRQAALKAESVIATIPQAQLPVPAWVAGASSGTADRLMSYLADV